MEHVKEFDIDVYNAIKAEEDRQEYGIELIASENFVSKAVMEAAGSVLTNKYAEGYPGKRYYGGCKNVDIVEQLAIERTKELFNVKYVNVQPHSGSQANMGVYVSLLNPGDKILGMSLDAGGHLTHGYKVTFSGTNYVGIGYGLNPETEKLDYDMILKLAEEHKPQIIVAGASSYSQIIDFKKFREIADKVGAYLLVDMAHIAGLVAAGEHPSPIEHAHVVTTTTHKTLRGPRGGIIMTNDEEIAKKIDKNVFPGIQGGPLMHVIAAKAVAMKEALDPTFVEYQKQVKKNAKALAETLEKGGLRIISGGTENHLLLVDLRAKNITGKEAEKVLEIAGITCNKNAIPNDPEKPFVTSGIRLGTPAVTTRGMKEPEMVKIGEFIIAILENANDEEKLKNIYSEVITFTKQFPLYK